ncbi:uncharacterized protein HD556DRAFT_1314457 [Suillus plorans]|uniref:Uncharacterized protein n=1 Tax=Suillus plorans TaxID=116603 RepID=A0A9P7ABP5_9AGAM|nr:uncharacterized protein HD556DRAFT_1314457 [Suillus plorans]KAG1785195.1 hypothetical protein HD556DRAFT_1314457 [Suillus plorans]
MVEIIAPSINSDPVLEVQLNFELPAFAACTAALVTSRLTAEAALTQLVDGWTQECQERMVLWQQQLDEDAHTLQEAADHEWEKKKPKINDFNADLPVSDIIIPHPSQFALQKVKNMESIQLWYFSPDGCQEAQDWNKSSADDALGLEKIDDIVTLKSFSSFKASNKALQDHDLSWRQFNMAKTSFLIHMEKASWPDKHQMALTLFFTLITNHKHRLRPWGEKTLLHYASMVHRDWHDRLTLNQGFNIGLFNNALYNSL